MPRFRPRTALVVPAPGPLSLADARRLIADAIRPGHFFVGPARRLEWDHIVAEEVSWEVFRGRLLAPAHTRERRTFEAWNIYVFADGVRSPEPLLSVKLDAADGQIHVVRAIHCYAWEGYDAGDNVILSRETRKWVRELVGTFHLADFASADELQDEIICQLFQAVVGTSRLPLTSVEAPLPAFTLGQMAYLCEPTDLPEPMRSWREVLKRACRTELRHMPKFLEAVLRAMPAGELPLVANYFCHSRSDGGEPGPRPLLRVLRDLFNEVSLSPFTDLTEKALALARQLTEPVGRYAELADCFLGHLLRQLGRHLTAYDLVLFHHAGANYPDALLLDAVLGEYLTLIERRPDLLLDAPEDERERRLQRLRRRALRQAWLVRRRYRGHAVPDAPTSPGENARVLPQPFVRVPDEQIVNARRRTKQLFMDEWPGGGLGANVRAAVRQSIRDLEQPNELRELGVALYLDRPLGAFKAPGEPDQTPLLSYTAFSRNIAMRRLLLLAEDKTLLPDDELTSLRQALQDLPVSGVPVAQIRSVPRPGVVSLADAAKAAEDFVFLRTTASSLRDFFALFDFAPLADCLGMPGVMNAPWLVLGKPAPVSGEIVLTFHEPGSLRKRLEVSVDAREGYIVRAGVEYPRKGLRVWRVWEEADGELRVRDLRGEDLWARPL
jgi:hypothetical protein